MKYRLPISFAPIMIWINYFRFKKLILAISRLTSAIALRPEGSQGISKVRKIDFLAMGSR